MTRRFSHEWQKILFCVFIRFIMITPVLFNNRGLVCAPVKVQNYGVQNSTKPVRMGTQQASFVNFKGAINSCDTFVKCNEPQFGALIQSIYTKMKSQLRLFTPEQLETAIQNVMREVPNTNETQVLTVMQRLTQWANYRCIEDIGNALTNLEVGTIENSTHINRVFNYLQESKGLIQTDKNSKKLASFVTDSNLSEILQEKPMSEVFINLEGFDAGVNIFSDDRKLQECTVNTLRKVQNLPDKSFNDALDCVLNKRINGVMQSHGYEVKTIQIKNSPTRENILKQMSPYYPESPEIIAQKLERVAKYFTQNDKYKYSELLYNMADYFDLRLNVFSKQRIVESLQTLKIKIDAFLKEKNLPSDRVFYVIPSEGGTNKSYGLITQMFARNNDIPPEKVITIDSAIELNLAPNHSTYVVLDDFIGSGDSMSNVANYIFDRYKLSNNNHLLFCPVTACDDGINTLNLIIENGNRINKDFIITPDENIQKITWDDRNKKLDLYFTFNEIGKNVYGNEGFVGDGSYFSGSTIFPYMSPDNNSDLASFVTELFLPNPNPIKRKHFDFSNV